jgi:hypothetical protein
LKGARTKRQHYVPRFYLAYFIDADGFVHTYDKQEGICRAAKPEDTAKESNFYSFDGPDGEHVDQLESTLSEIESLAAPVHARLIEGQIPKSDDREAYALFLATLYIRTPAMVNAMARFYGDLAQIGSLVAGNRLEPESFLAEFEAERGEAIASEDRTRIVSFLSDKKNITMNVDRRIGLNALSAAPTISKLMVEMSWVVLEIEGGHLVTSDNPVVRVSPPQAQRSPYGDGGFLHKGMYVTVPLSPTRMLELCWGPGDYSKTVKADRERRKLYNRVRAMYSERYLYADRHDGGVLALAKKYPLPGMRIDSRHPSERFPIKLTRRLKPREGAT